MANILTNCCLCLNSEATNLINIFEKESINESIATVITKHFWFEIKETDSNKYICAVCWSKVEDFNTFYMQVYNKHKKIFNDQEILKVIIEEDFSNGCQSNNSKLDSQANNSESNWKFNNDICKNKTLNDRVEIEDEVSDDNSEVDRSDILLDNNSENGASDDKIKPNPIISKSSKCSRRVLNKNIVKVVEIKDEISDDNSDVDRSDILLDNNSENGASDDKIKPNPIVPKCSRRVLNKNIVKNKNDEENKQIQEYFSMECEFCPFLTDTFQNIQFHYRKEHKMRGYLRCCNRKFMMRSSFVEHIDRHLNPNNFKCDICNKTYAHKRSLMGHLKCHLSAEKRPFKCNECPKAYSKKSLFKNHLATHNDVKLFACNDCGKSFSTNNLLQAHTKNIHGEAKIYICDVCAKEFRSKLSLEHHQKTVHENIVMPKVQCQVCGIWLKDKQILRKHMIGHEDSKSDHFCSICGKKSLNRKALHKHVKTVHSGIVYNCNLCEKTFKKQISLTEHIASHTGATLYTCPHCPKTFNSSANMYSHKKKTHVKEWEEQERLKTLGFVGNTK